MKSKKKLFLIGTSFFIFFTFVIFLPFKKITNFKNENTNTTFKQQNILTNQVGFTGLEFGHANRIWVNDQAGVSGVYRSDGEIVKTKNTKGDYVPLFVSVDPKLFAQVFSEGHSFLEDAFIFTTLEGKIYGWHKNLDTGIEETFAKLRINNSVNNSVYTGITIKKTINGYRLYVADSYNNKIETYDEKYVLQNTGDKFIDHNLSEDFSVYNLKEIAGYIYVTYKNKNNESGGVINVFDENGEFVKRLVTDVGLASPYGLAKALENFGGPDVSDSLLVGNNATGKISIYDFKTGEYKGNLKSENGEDFVVLGLLALTFGTNNGAGRSNELFFTSSGETGIFGKLIEIVQKNNHDNKTEIKNKDDKLSEQQILEKDFLEQNTSKISYNDFMQKINQDCLSNNCVNKNLEKKTEELKFVYNKIFSDGDIIINEFKRQKIGKENTEKINYFLSFLEKQDIKRWTEHSLNECNIYSLNFYSEKNTEESVDLCMLYKIENWLKQLYILRSIYIRVEMSPVGILSSVASTSLSESFKKIVDEEENRVEKSY